MRGWHIFLLTLLCALIVQSFVWKTGPLLDESLWLKDLAYLQQGDPRLFEEITVYAYPAIPLLYLPLLLHTSASLSLQSALVGTLIVLIALGIAGITFMCYCLRPHQPWWLAAAAITTLSPLYIHSTLASAIVVPLITLVLLLTLYVIEHHQTVNRSTLHVLGILLGCCALVRFDIAATIGVYTILILLPSLRWQTVTIVGSTALLTFYVLNPFMWKMPLTHSLDLLTKIYHYSSLDTGHITLSTVSIYFPLASISWLLAVLTISLNQRLTSLSQTFIASLLFLTAGVSLIIVGADGANIRYLFPLFLAWEVFLPLFVLDVITARQAAASKPQRHWTLAPHVVVGLFIVVASIRFLTAF